jgi:hypothetical protein
MWRIRLMKKSGACRTCSSMKVRPPTSVSSQVTRSRAKKSEVIHSRILMPRIWRTRWLVDVGDLDTMGLTGRAIRMRMTMPAATAMAACL